MMEEIYLNDDEVKDNLFPFSITRSVADIRVGILTIREKWELLLNQRIQLSDNKNLTTASATIFAANIIPSRKFINSLVNGSKDFSKDPDWQAVRIVQYPWNIFGWNDWAIREDFILLTHDRITHPIPKSVITINPREIFIEEGAIIGHCTLNASTGPIYIGRNAEIMEGSCIRGPFALCEGATVKMGARIYGATTIGPYSIAGGEIKNSVIFGYSNKAHDGYLGDAVIGEWCNIGAGSSNSNLKNNAQPVKVWNQSSKDYIMAGLKCGLMMGDYSRCAINTSFNTGTVVGICSNVFGEGLTPKYIPCFTWGTKGFSNYEFEKALADIRNWKKLKGFDLTTEEITTLRNIFDHQ